VTASNKTMDIPLHLITNEFYTYMARLFNDFMNHIYDKENCITKVFTVNKNINLNGSESYGGRVIIIDGDIPDQNFPPVMTGLTYAYYTGYLVQQPLMNITIPNFDIFHQWLSILVNNSGFSLDTYFVSTLFKILVKDKSNLGTLKTHLKLVLDQLPIWFKVNYKLTFLRALFTIVFASNSYEVVSIVLETENKVSLLIKPINIINQNLKIVKNSIIISIFLKGNDDIKESEPNYHDQAELMAKDALNNSVLINKNDSNEQLADNCIGIGISANSIVCNGVYVPLLNHLVDILKYNQI
jgi:hypothetical protein